MTTVTYIILWSFSVFQQPDLPALLPDPSLGLLPESISWLAA
jgi:hypothetical protein